MCPRGIINFRHCRFLISFNVGTGSLRSLLQIPRRFGDEAAAVDEGVRGGLQGIGDGRRRGIGSLPRVERAAVADVVLPGEGGAEEG